MVLLFAKTKFNVAFPSCLKASICDPDDPCDRDDTIVKIELNSILTTETAGNNGMSLFSSTHVLKSYMIVIIFTVDRQVCYPFTLLNCLHHLHPSSCAIASHFGSWGPVIRPMTC